MSYYEGVFIDSNTEVQNLLTQIYKQPCGTTKQVHISDLLLCPCSFRLTSIGKCLLSGSTMNVWKRN